MKKWWLFPLLVACVLMTAGFSKKPKFMISVHSQGSDMDNPRTIFPESVGNPPRQIWLRKVPEFSHFNLVAFHPFPADDGTYGVALKLDFKGANALEVVTRTRQGEILRSYVNGEAVDWVTIDKPVKDGIFTIWRGVSEEALAYMEEEYPRIGDVGSASSAMPMLPTTKREKKEALREVRERQQEIEEMNRERAKMGLPPLTEAEAGLLPN